MSKGVELIAQERQRQITSEGYTKESDAVWDSGELSLAAACYAMGRLAGSFIDSESFLHKNWPFPCGFYKPCPDDRVNELVKAGAFIAAEIDRLTAD